MFLNSWFPRRHLRGSTRRGSRRFARSPETTCEVEKQTCDERWLSDWNQLLWCNITNSPDVSRPRHRHDQEGHQVNSDLSGEQELDALSQLLRDRQGVTTRTLKRSWSCFHINKVNVLKLNIWGYFLTPGSLTLQHMNRWVTTYLVIFHLRVGDR